MWDLSPLTRDWTHASCVESASLKNETTREVQYIIFFIIYSYCTAQSLFIHYLYKSLHMLTPNVLIFDYQFVLYIHDSVSICVVF